MSNYSVVTEDTTLLVSQVNAYLASNFNMEDTEHHNSAFHWLGTATDLEPNISAISTTFTDKNLTVAGLGVFSINLHYQGIIVSGNYVLIPLSDTTTANISFYTANSGVVPSSTPDGIQYYNANDCTLVETVSLATSTIAINANTVMSMTSEDSTHLADILLVAFNEGVSSLL